MFRDTCLFILPSLTQSWFAYYYSRLTVYVGFLKDTKMSSLIGSNCWDEKNIWMCQKLSIDNHNRLILWQTSPLRYFISDLHLHIFFYHSGHVIIHALRHRQVNITKIILTRLPGYLCAWSSGLCRGNIYIICLGDVPRVLKILLKWTQGRKIHNSFK